MRDDISPSILAVGASLANLRRGARRGNGSTPRSTIGSLARRLGAAPEQAVAQENVPQVSHVDTAEKAVELLKVLKFDLVAIGHDVPDATPWQLARKVRSSWPWQKWALVAHEMDHEDEIMARSLGAVAIFEGPEAWREMVDVASRVRRKNPAAVSAGLIGV
jgi:DNA-binding response OmpR family regulator